MRKDQESVITPERFQQGLTWRDWLERLEENREDFEANYAGVTLDPAAIAAIKTMMAMPRGPNVWGVSRHGPGKVLAICEPWCVDVVRGLPVMARLCEATGMELRILSRDANPDIMAEVLYKGEYQSIPVFIFYTKSDEYLGHWIEMPAMAREEQGILEQVTGGKPASELGPEEPRRFAEEYKAFQQGPVWDKWRQAQVAEVRELLATAIERATALEEIRDMAFFD